MDSSKELMMMIKMENQNHIDIPSDPFSSLPAFEVAENTTSLGFMELLGFQDFTTTYNKYSSSIFDNIHHQLPSSAHPEDVTVVDELGEESSVVLNSLPNSSVHVPAPLKQCMKAKKTIGDHETQKKKKKEKEKEREARFAFMTRTEIDHLDDGYRWRKYGQKAVKNSPFPRSYYRCTSASCNVKKRVERCMGDPSFVVTTYQGQHIHPTPCCLLL